MKTGGKKSGSRSSRGSSSLQCRQVAELFPSSSGRRKTKREKRGPFWSKSWPISSFFFGVVPLLAGHATPHTQEVRCFRHSSIGGARGTLAMQQQSRATPMATNTKVFSCTWAAICTILCCSGSGTLYILCLRVKSSVQPATALYISSILFTHLDLHLCSLSLLDQIPSFFCANGARL